jgi:Holliday junction DNA helicase, RuvA subunit
MIVYVKGELIEVLEEQIIIDVQGMGYGIFMSAHALETLPSTGTEIKVHTYMNVKEDDMQLFGFLSRDELAVFKLVIGVNGIGPKGGLHVLSTFTPDELRFAVAASDAKAIAKSPGIGKKTAEKLILELRDKLHLEDTLSQSDTSENQRVSANASDVQKEAIQALVTLGYGSTEAAKAVRRVEISDEVGVEDILKQALKYIV